jgi:hypothetical protein
VSSILEDLKPASGYRGMSEVAMANWDDCVILTPYKERGHPLREVGTIKHCYRLTTPIHARPKCSQNGLPSCSVRQGVKDAKDLLYIASERRAQSTEQFAHRPTGQLRWGQTQERHEDPHPRDGGQSQKGANAAADPTAAHQDEAFATLRELVSELGGYASAEGMADDGNPIDLQDTQEIAHSIGIRSDRVVGSGLVRASVPEQIRSNNSVAPG